jgi:hypothetical protein
MVASDQIGTQGRWIGRIVPLFQELTRRGSREQWGIVNDSWRLRLQRYCSSPYHYGIIVVGIILAVTTEVVVVIVIIIHGNIRHHGTGGKQLEHLLHTLSTFYLLLL